MCFGVCLPDCPLQTSLLDFTCNSNCPAAKGRRAAWRLPGWMPTFMTLHQTGGSPDVFFVCVCFYTPPALCLCHLARVSWGWGASSLSSPQSAPPPLTGIVAVVNLPRLTLVIIPSLICLITLLAAVWNTLAYFCHHPCAAVNMDSRRLRVGGNKNPILCAAKSR